MKKELLKQIYMDTVMIVVFFTTLFFVIRVQLDKHEQKLEVTNVNVQM